jgi:hypothetical protein
MNSSRILTPAAGGGFEITPDGKPAARLEVRGYTDNYTRATLRLGNDDTLLLVAVPRPTYESSTEVQRLTIELAREVMTAVLADVMPEVKIERTVVVAPGASLDDPTH